MFRDARGRGFLNFGRRRDGDHRRILRCHRCAVDRLPALTTDACSGIRRSERNLVAVRGLRPVFHWVSQWVQSKQPGNRRNEFFRRKRFAHHYAVRHPLRRPLIATLAGDVNDRHVHRVGARGLTSQPSGPDPRSMSVTSAANRGPAVSSSARACTPLPATMTSKPALESSVSSQS